MKFDNLIKSTFVALFGVYFMFEVIKKFCELDAFFCPIGNIFFAYFFLSIIFYLSGEFYS